MLKNTSSRLLIISATLLLVLACETSEDDTIEKARTCVDNAGKMAFDDPDAAADAALECDSMITNSGLTTKEAFRIQFGAILIKQKKLDRIAEMADAAKNQSTVSGSPADGLNSAINIMVFTGGTTDGSDAARIKTAGSNLGGYSKVVGEFAYFATRLDSLSNITDATSANNAAAACAGDASCTADVAATIISMQQGACASSVDQNSTDPNNMCYKLKQITNGSEDPDVILTNLNFYLDNTH